jgi:serine/threonine protein kinase
MTLTTGQVLHNRYRIVKLIGQGGFGAVYRAWDLSLKQPLALKENLDTSQEGQRQFEREANMMAGLRHPNLARVTDHFLIAGQGQYLVMDFIEGTDLDELLQRRAQPFTETEVESWLRQVGGALTYLHARQPPIIHRDLKPQNIIVTPSGEAMLVDFGISKLYNPNQKTTMGARAVTPGYSPPEQYGGGRTDARTDVYALAATMYMLLTGQEPPESVMLMVGGVSLTPPGQLNGRISAAAEAAIMKGMEINGSQRYPAVADFVNAFCAETRNAHHQTTTSIVNQSAALSKQPSIAAFRHQPTGYPFKAPSADNPADIEWVEIPAGKFLYGAKKEECDINEPFWIGKYPVTNKQYQRFLDANPDQPVPDHWDQQKKIYPPGKANHPVVHISWHDAQAFCQWANYCLPTEEEWEKAARGTDGRTYPWGEDWLPGKYCNSQEASIGGTSPVGGFPEGVSPYGVWDMCGNVWEWTSGRVLRGGSFYGLHFSARAAYRRSFTPVNRADDYGFRVVVRRPPPHP